MPKKIKNIKKKLLDVNLEKFIQIAMEDLGSGKATNGLGKRGAEILAKFTKARKPVEKKRLFEALCSQVSKYRAAASLDTNVLTKLSISDAYIPMALGMIKSLRTRFDVKTDDDKAYVQLAVIAFCRYKSNMAQFELLKKYEFISRDRVSYMQMLSKDTDRAYKQWEASVSHLEFKNRPPIKMNIKTQTAFFAQNQQNIANPINKDENNE